MYVLLDEVFGSGPHIGWAQECARAALIFFYGLGLVRIAGRRAFARWSAVDIVVAIIVGSNLSRALTGSAPLSGTLLGTAALMLLHWVFARGAAHSSVWSRLVEGRSIELARDGHLNQLAALSENVSDADLEEALRSSRLERLGDAKLIVLEPSGKINVLA